MHPNNGGLKISANGLLVKETRQGAREKELFTLTNYVYQHKLTRF
jgi:hypothetical protein